MIKDAREAVDALVGMDRVTDPVKNEVTLSKIVKFLRKNPDQLDNFASRVRNESDASNSVTPYHRICLVLRRALEGVK